MRTHFLASLLALALVGFAHGANAESVSADEQLLKAANLKTDGPALLDYFRKHTLNAANRDRIPLLIKQLGSDDFDVREKASADIVAIGPRAIPALRPALKDPDAEVARRAEACLRQLEPGGKDAPSPSVTSAAARLVALRKPAGAAEVLLDYLPFADHVSVVEEIESALATVALREGKPEPVLVKGLTAADPHRRGFAGAALARTGAAEHKKAIRKLLEDADPTVRLRIGLALAAVKDKEAVPVLIDLLAELPSERVWSVESLLQQLAGVKAPSVVLGNDAAGKKKCRDAWAAWWKDHGGVLEMPALDAPRSLQGYTLVVAPESGLVFELDRAGKERWRVERLNSAFDVQLLPRDRLLIAEYNGRVTERNLKGEILWEKAVPHAMQCQRLPNGNTFVVSLRTLVEIDPKGKETVVYTHNSNSSSLLVVARKLRNGEIIAIDSDGTCKKLDATGKELSKFAVGRISNNCLDVLPNGNLVVAKLFDGKVTEYDPEGKVVWEVKCPSAFSPKRLPNGNTLVVCHETCKVVELNRAGETVWEYNGMPQGYRAWYASRR